MTIGIDIRALAQGNRTGVEEYLINLLSPLFLLDSSIKYKLFYNSWHKATLPGGWLNSPNVEVKEFRIPNRLLSSCFKYIGWPKIDEMIGSPRHKGAAGGVDIFFSPHFLIAGLSKKCPRVITFHDLSFEYFPEFFSLERQLWHLSVNPRQQAKKADKIIVVSESTKEDLVDLYKIPEKKIKVIYSGLGSQFKSIGRLSRECQAVRIKYNLPDRFILYFGTLEPRKNLVGLIRAFEIFKKDFTSGENKAVKLVLAGSKGWLYEQIFKTAKNSSLSDEIIFSGFVEPADKAFFYNLADLFVYPSFFEGFGFPPLEAMGCGIPVITSNVSSLPEIVNGAGLMINPYNTSEMAWAINEALTDHDLRRFLIEKGLEQAKKFSWEKCAKETLQFMIQ